MLTKEALNWLGIARMIAINQFSKEREETLAEAFEMAISALQDREEAELLTRDGLECVENVRVSKQLATLLRPYHGCPRGPMGPKVGVSALELLRDAKKYLLAGPDDRFVCIPTWDYEVCLRALERAQEAAKIETPTKFDLTETEDVGHGQVGKITSP